MNKIKHNWKTLIKNIGDYLKSLRWKVKRDLSIRKIKYINGMGTFLDNKTVQIMLPEFKNDQVTYKEIDRVVGKNILIAVGSRPAYPASPPELKQYAITSDDLFYLKDPPGKTLVIGAGYIALECAGFLHGLGFPVTVSVRKSLLRRLDEDLMKLVKDYMIEEGIKFCFGCEVKSVARIHSNSSSGYKRESFVVTWLNKNTNIIEEDVYDTILCATGRFPATKFLNLDKINMNFAEEVGKIFTANEITSVNHIFAAGDVILDSPELAPAAIQSAKLLIQRVYGPRKKKFFTYKDIPTTMFTPLEYGAVGYTERSARLLLGGPDAIEVLHGYFYPLEWEIPRGSRGGDNSKCYFKVISLVADDKVVGIHFTGPNAGEVIQGFAVAVKHGVTVGQLESTVGVHPTAAEEITRLAITKRSGQNPRQLSCCS